MATDAYTLVWVDAAGGNSFRTIKVSGDPSAIITALTARSNAGIAQYWGGPLNQPGNLPTIADYPTAAQVAYLRFVDASGAVANVALPAPPTSIFLADGINVDPSQITGIISACVGTLVTASGAPVVAYQSGTLGRGQVTL